MPLSSGRCFQCNTMRMLRHRPRLYGKTKSGSCSSRSLYSAYIKHQRIHVTWHQHAPQLTCSSFQHFSKTTKVKELQVTQSIKTAITMCKDVLLHYIKVSETQLKFCKSLLFLLVNLVTVSLHCSNYIARRHQIHTSCIIKDKGVW